MSDLKKYALDYVDRSQPSFLLLVLGNAVEGKESQFADWFKWGFRDQLRALSPVLNARMYERDSVDITWGRFAPVPMKYMALVDTLGNGPEGAHQAIDFVQNMFTKEDSAAETATWLYYPVSPKYGLESGGVPHAVMVHYTNPVPGMEAEYAEWFNTRLLRLAPVFDPLVNAQRFERSMYQNPGALEPEYQTIALYDQAGPSEQLIEAFKNPPQELLDMVSLDNERFKESTYLPLV